jgi:transposase-like protein
MTDNSRDRLTLARRFTEPSNSTHRRYEALRAFFVEGVPSAEAAARFGYTPGSLRVLVHQFRNHPGRDFFVPTAREGRPPGKQSRLREQVVALRKQNLGSSPNRVGRKPPVRASKPFDFRGFLLLLGVRNPA